MTIRSTAHAVVSDERLIDQSSQPDLIFDCGMFSNSLACLYLRNG